MNVTFAILQLFATGPFVLAQSPTTSDQQSGPTIFVDRAASDIFPESWLTSKVNAKAELLIKSEQQRCRELVEQALAKYPAAVLSANLKQVYVVGHLEYSGVATGGTNSRTAVYIVGNDKYSAAQVEKNCHAEFSSILLRNFPQYFDKEKWLQINPPDFHYRGSGVQAIKGKQSSLRLTDALHEEGFLNEYAKASIEEDFNSIAARLFMGDTALWSAIDKYPKVKAKAEVTTEFYEKLDAKFDWQFFQSLRPALKK